MATPLNITTAVITSEKDEGRVYDMNDRCAFAICAEGDLDVKILNEVYHVTDHCIFACMPFVSIEIVKVRRKGKLIVGGIMLEDVFSLIHRTVNSRNLLAIQQTPLVKISAEQLRYLSVSIKEYLGEVEDYSVSKEASFSMIDEEIISCHSRLIVAQVIKIYYTNLPMQVSGHTHRDLVFQHFILDMYAHCREERNVMFYARRSGVSVKYFSTLVRQISGKSPSEWIENAVGGQAKLLLGDIHRSIKDIASLLNFPDAPTFTKYFHRVMGMTPKAYRAGLAISSGGSMPDRGVPQG